MKGEKGRVDRLLALGRGGGGRGGGCSRNCREGVSSLGRYVFGSEISYNKAPPRLPGLGC
jgi:hypothetical protein